MEAAIAVACGVGLLLAGGRVGFFIGRAYERKIAIEAMKHMATQLTIRLGGNPTDIVRHITAIRDSMK